MSESNSNVNTETFDVATLSNRDIEIHKCQYIVLHWMLE